MSKIADFLRKTITFPAEGGHILDPICKDEPLLSALLSAVNGESVTVWGITAGRGPDRIASQIHIVRGPAFEARVNPLECMGLLVLNPPIAETGKYLKHTIKWLAPEGILILVVPEALFTNERARQWIGMRFKDISIHSLSNGVAILIGVKKPRQEQEEDNAGAVVVPGPPYRSLSSCRKKYQVPYTEGPRVFQGEDRVTPEDVEKNTPKVLEYLKQIGVLKGQIQNTISPLFPLRKGHLVAILTSGALNGLIETPDGFLIIKGFTDRETKVKEHPEGGITEEDTYRVGIRVMGPDGWYDVE